MIALSVAKLKVFSPESEVFVENLDQIRPLEEREKARNVFAMSLRLSDLKVLQNIACSSSFFRFRLDVLPFFALSKLL